MISPKLLAGVHCSHNSWLVTLMKPWQSV